MEREVADEVEDFGDLPLRAEEIERRRTKELVNGLSPDLWGRIAGYCSKPSDLVNTSLTNRYAQIGARRSRSIVLHIMFPASPSHDERFGGSLCGFMDLECEEEGEGGASETPPWNDCKLWERYPEKFECLKRPAGGSLCAKSPNGIMIVLDCHCRRRSADGDEYFDVRLDRSKKALLCKLGARVLGIRADDWIIDEAFISRFPKLYKLDLSKVDGLDETVNLGWLGKTTHLKSLCLKFVPDCREEDLNGLCNLEKLALRQMSDVNGSCLSEMPKIRHLDIDRTLCDFPFDFSRLETLPRLVILSVESADELSDAHLERLLLKSLKLICCDGVTGSCFESEILQEHLSERLEIVGCQNMVPGKLANLKRLRCLEVESEVAGGFGFLREMPELREVRVNDSSCSDEDFIGLPVCEVLICHCENVNGSCLSQMPNLKKATIYGELDVDEKSLCDRFEITEKEDEFQHFFELRRKEDRPNDQ